MKRTNKKGFTIVELVIVIAVIAILAAVLIPNISRLVKKANESADIQACRQMNTQLAMNEVTEGKDINKVYSALKEGGMTAKDYKPLSSNTYFFWDSTLNRVLYTNSKYEVLYPEEYKSAKKEDNGWFSLSGEINKEKIEATTENNKKTYKVKNAEQLYYLVSENKAVEADIVFDVDTIDLMGADIGFDYGKIAKGNFTISGTSGGTTIKGLAQLKNASVGTTKETEGRKYASGFISLVGISNENNGIQITIKDITIENAAIGDSETGGVGAVVGRIEKNATVTLDNVHVKNTVVNGKNKVGGFVGHIQSGNLIVKDNCSLENVTVNCTEGESGKIIGALNQTASLKIVDYNNNATYKTFEAISMQNVTLNLVKDEHERQTVAVKSGAKVSATTTNTNKKNQNFEFTSDAILVQKVGKDGWRIFYSDAYATYVMDGSNKTLNDKSIECIDVYDFTVTIDNKSYDGKFVGLRKLTTAGN